MHCESAMLSECGTDTLCAVICSQYMIDMYRRNVIFNSWPFPVYYLISGQSCTYFLNLCGVASTSLLNLVGTMRVFHTSGIFV